MISKALLLVLIGCGLAFASPVERETELSDKVIPLTNEEIQKAIEDVLVKVSEAVKNVFKALFRKIGQQLNSEELKNAVEQLKHILEEAFQGQEDNSPSDEQIQNAVNKVLKTVCEAFNDVLRVFLDQIEEQVNDESLKKSIEQLKNVLERIFDYNPRQAKTRSISNYDVNEIEELTDEELEKIRNELIDLIQKWLKQMMEVLGKEISSEDALEIRKALEEIFSNSVINHRSQDN